ncbi:MAG: formylglycine-generating enzyme family protein [Deltaproteobacteria bacterium]|jgi:formylglycine-generating enzyme required for sulfatase activity|nr:formylglycine-generating enzyme family protein [Deltaproteobacteria bacterium]
MPRKSLAVRAGMAVAAVACALMLPSARLGAESFTTRGGMEFVKIEPGTFSMGDSGSGSSDSPRHTVNITRPFWIGKFEVTQAQYRDVTGTGPSAVEGPDDPVECVSWHEASRFAQLVADREGRNGFRLPTEAEWEFAARAGEGVFLGGRGASGIGAYGWHGGNSKKRHHPVGQKKANAWGLHDVHGNVWEWVADWYDAGYYRKSPQDDPKGPPSGKSRIFRGGAWPWQASSANLARRGNYSFQNYAGKCPYAPAPEDQEGVIWDTDLGFRLAFSEKGVQQIMRSGGTAGAFP